LIDDFNLIITTLRGLESQLCSETEYLLTEELGETEPIIEKSEIRGLIVAKISLDPLKVVRKLRAIIHEYPYKIRYALRIIPIQKVIVTNLEEIRQVSTDFTRLIPEKSTFRITVEKRYTSIHTKDFIEAAASTVKRKVDLVNPDFILLIEVLGDLTGISLIKPKDILAVTKEKML
jgi:tRNA acetyltransferase TAN1